MELLIFTSPTGLDRTHCGLILYQIGIQRGQRGTLSKRVLVILPYVRNM